MLIVKIIRKYDEMMIFMILMGLVLTLSVLRLLLYKTYNH